MRRLHIALSCLLTAALLAGCKRSSPPAVALGPKSPPGWEVRYNATVALARRGSDRIKDEHVWEILQEMLDEEQQLRNFRRPLKDKSDVEVSDAGAAQITVITALQAINELHRLKPALDLAGLQPALEKLSRSGSIAVNTEAKRTQQLLAKKS